MAPRVPRQTPPIPPTTEPKKSGSLSSLTTPLGKKPTTTSTTIPTKPSAGLSNLATPLKGIGEVAKGVGVPAGKVEEVVKGKEKGLIGKLAYLPFYPLDKLLEIEDMIPGAINQIQNLREGKPVDVGSFTDPFGDKGIIREVGRTIVNAPRKTEFFQGAQDLKGYSTVVDNPYLAFGMNVALAPSTWLSGGVGGVSKGALLSIAKGGAKKAFSETGEALTKAAAKQLAKEAAESAARNGLEEVVKKGALAGADELVKAEQTLARATKAADKARAAVVAQEASEEVLGKAVKDYAVSAGRKGGGRVYGARGREAIASDLIDVAETARKTLADEAAGLITLTPKAKSEVQLLANTLTDAYIGDIATKGYGVIRGAEANTLLTRSGLTWGVGENKVWVPLTEGLANAFGTGVVRIRTGTGVAKELTGIAAVDRLIETGLQGLDSYKAIAKWTTNVGRKGVAGEKGIRDLRASLRTGEAKGEQATEAIRTLTVDRNFRRNFANEKGLLDVVISPIYDTPAVDRPFAKSVSELIENPNIVLFDETIIGGVPMAADTAVTASRKLGRTVTDAELDLARRSVGSFDEMYEQANGAYRTVQQRAGVPADKIVSLPRTNNYFPHVPTERAIDWAAPRKDGDVLLGFDRSTLGSVSSPRRLGVGSKIGKYTITAEDLSKGVKRLNEIYKQEYGIKFDWFETDIGVAAAKQAERVAADIAFLKTVDDEIEAGKSIRAIKTEERPIAPSAYDLEARLLASLTPQKLEVINTIPEARLQLEDVIDELNDLDALTKAPSKAGLANEVEAAKERIIEAADTLARREDVVDAATSAVVSFEADALAESLASQAKNIKTNVLARPVSDWRKVVPMLEDGFKILNDKVLPGVQAQRQLAELIQNAERFNDPKFVRLLNRYMAAYNRLFKSWVTATPGFHMRNTISNGFFMTVAGADMKNVLEANEVYGRWLKFIESEKGVARTQLPAIAEARRAVVAPETGGLDLALIDDFLDKAYPEVSLREREAIGDALRNIAVAGFGRTTEVFEGVARGLGGGPGILGGEARNAVSRTLGKPLSWSRNTGEWIENYSRFALTYDGLVKGMTAEQAAARTARYLIDYQDLSRADAVLKQIIPFWMWASRAVPLMIESMWTRPRAFAVYQNIKRSITSEEGEDDLLPPWMESGGAFKAPFNIGGNTYLQPDLGFTGLTEDITGFTTPTGLLAQVTPGLKAPLEAWLNYDSFRKRQIANKEFDPEADKKIRQYLVNQFTVLGPVMQRYARVGAAAAEVLNQDSLAQFIRKASFTEPPEYLQQRGITEPEPAQNINTLASFLGLSVRNLLDYQQQDVFEERQKRLQMLAKQKVEENLKK
jgi:Fe-S cluster assembly iron-binding protein IscA